jgi:hypothetical protein
MHLSQYPHFFSATVKPGRVITLREKQSLTVSNSNQEIFFMNKLNFALSVVITFVAPIAFAQATGPVGPAPVTPPVGQAAPAQNRVNQREENQQDRIGNGVKSGQLTPGETQHLEHGEQRIDNQVARDRAANGGHLTGQERRQVNREQNRESGRIYRDKHNGRTAK